MKEHGRELQRYSGYSNEPAIQVICLGSGGGPSEDNVTGFLVRATATNWSKNSVIAVDAGTHLAAITRILEKDFPLVANPDAHVSNLEDVNVGCRGNIGQTDAMPLSDDESGSETPTSARDAPFTITSLNHGCFAGLPFPYLSARANALHIVREHISTYLITHPHLDHVSGFVMNTAAFHNTSRPKRLAALPFTVNAIKTHLFNDIIWPNLTDEDGGVGLVTFQRLAEGGNIALGEGSGRGFIEVCDGLGVKGFKVTHGQCMEGPSHGHRGPGASVPETPSRPALISFQTQDSLENRSMSLSSLSNQTNTGTPGPNEDRRASATPVVTTDRCVTDSTAYFIRAEPTLTTPKREVLIFGDVEPDSISLLPRTATVWAEAAPKIAAGILKGIFIECSYTNATSDAVLFGHLAPRHLLAELTALADMVRVSRKESECAREEARRGRKRKRAVTALQLGSATATEEHGRRAKAVYLGPLGKAIDSPLSGTSPYGLVDDVFLPDFALPHNEMETHTPLPIEHVQPAHTANNADAMDTTASEQPHHPPIDLSALPPSHSKTLLATAFDEPLKGVKIVIIHVKDTFADGPLIGEQILKELQAGEKALKEDSRGLGCTFEISKGGESYWF